MSYMYRITPTAFEFYIPDEEGQHIFDSYQSQIATLRAEFEAKRKALLAECHARLLAEGHYLPETRKFTIGEEEETGK